MAGSSKKGTSNSPKRTRKRKAAAAAPESESEGTSKSPKRTRQGKATTSKTGSGGFSNEDYNIRSPQRTKLLTKIKGVFDNAPVSPVLWACCQLADMDRLQAIANSDKRAILAH